MNGKRAKALRRLAREHSVGLPEREYSKPGTRKIRDKNGNIVREITGTVFLLDSFRLRYKQLKKAYKADQKAA